MTVPFVHSRASEKVTSHLEVGFERGKMMGRVLRTAIFRTMDSVKAPWEVESPMRAVAEERRESGGQSFSRMCSLRVSVF